MAEQNQSFDIYAAYESVKQELEQLKQTQKTLLNPSNVSQHQSQPSQPQIIQQVEPYYEPKISLPEKFDGSRHTYRGFINQIRLIIKTHSRRYVITSDKIGLVETLLKGPALAWFAPLLEDESSLLEDFEKFIKNLEETFGDADKERTAATKIRTLRQGFRPVSTYVSEFRQLASDLSWDNEALIDQFHYGLQDDVKDLLLTMEDPDDLNKAITSAVKCDNCLFERRQEKKHAQRNNSVLGSGPRNYMSSSNHFWRTSASRKITHLGAEPMQIDNT